MVAPETPPDDAGQSPLRPGDIVAGKYRVDRQIGRGGMGIVLAATHLQLEHQVAIKVLRRDLVEDDKALNRLFAEARAAAKIRSEHVARVLDVGTLDSDTPGAGAPFIVMEYLEGEDLADLLDRQGALDVTTAVQFLLQTCEALAEVHAAEMVHRDLKPGNLFVARLPDGSPSLKIVDFGISKHIGASAHGNPATTTSAVLGSPYYMPPEQMRAEPVDERSDIWSLGAILFEMLTGRPPFLGDTLPEVYAAVLSGTVQPVSSLRPDIPRGLDEIVQRCLDKDPRQRFEDVAELAEALRPYGGVTSAQSVERIVRILNNPQLFRGRPAATPQPAAAEPSPRPAGMQPAGAELGGPGTARGGVGVDPPLAPSPMLDVGPASAIPLVPTVVTPELVSSSGASFNRPTGSNSPVEVPLSVTAASGSPFTEVSLPRRKAGLRAAWGAVAFAAVLVGGALWMRVTAPDEPLQPEATPLAAPVSRPSVASAAPAPAELSGRAAAAAGEAVASRLAEGDASKAKAPSGAAADDDVTARRAAGAAGSAAPSADEASASSAAVARPTAVAVEALRPAPPATASAPAKPSAPAEHPPEKQAKPAPAPTPARAPRATAPRKAQPQNGAANAGASRPKANAVDPWNPSSFGDRR